MNKNGFAITGFIYTIFVIFIAVLFAILSLFNARKNILDNLQKGVLGEINEISMPNDLIYTTPGVLKKYSAKVKGYYNITLKSPKIGSTNGSTVNFELFLSKGETIYLMVGGSTSEATEIIDIKNETNTVLARASYNSSNNMIADEYNDRILMEQNIYPNNVTGSGSIQVKYTSKSKKNEDLNRVRYIKDCINGNSVNTENNWSKIKVLVDGDDKARYGVITSDVTSLDNHPYNNAIDGSKETFATASTMGEVCITLDLGRTYNIDVIGILHKQNVIYYGSKTYVSTDDKNYKLVRNYEEKENGNGLVISSYEESQVALVGNVYVPIKNFEGAKWLRVFHHNNLNNTVYWDSLAQVITTGGYDTLHNQSILYALDGYKLDSKYEFLLEYSDKDGYNRWSQTSNPVSTTESVTGYKALHIDFSDSNWYGLARSNSGKTLLDGSSGTPWNYAIGVISNEKNGVPIQGSNISNQITDLWVKIETLSTN